MPFIDFLRSKSFSRTGLSTIKSQGIPLWQDSDHSCWMSVCYQSKLNIILMWIIMLGYSWQRIPTPPPPYPPSTYITLWRPPTKLPTPFSNLVQSSLPPTFAPTPLFVALFLWLNQRRGNIELNEILVFK